MANVKISELPIAATPLTGAELIPIVQSNVTKQTTASDVLAAPATSLTASSAVATDASKKLVSVANTGTGSNVLATGPVITLSNATNLPLATGVTGVLPVLNGGSGTSSPSLVAGTNVTISGTWPNQTINSTDGGWTTPQMFGAIGDGVTDDTVAMRNWINSSSSLYLPKGSYKTGQLVFPTSFKTLTGEGSASKILGISTLAAGYNLLEIVNCYDVIIENLSIDLSACTLTGPNIVGASIGVSLCERVTIRNLTIPEAGRFFLFGNTSSWIEVDNIQVTSFTTSIVDLWGCGNSIINNIHSTHQGIYHTILVERSGGNTAPAGNPSVNVQITNCTVFGPSGTGGFGIEIYGSNYCTVQNCTVFATGLEGIQTTDGSYNRIIGNQIICSPGHQDFGISVFGDFVAAEQNQVIDNYIKSSGNSGVGISASFSPRTTIAQLNTVSNNTIVNPCQLTTYPSGFNRSGIQFLGGGLCTGNNVFGNRISDGTNLMTYGVTEENSGGFGETNPDNNKMGGDTVYGGASLLATYKVLGLNSVASDIYKIITRLTGNFTIYVATTGSDTAGTGTLLLPYATIQKAWNVAVLNYDLAGYALTISVGAGTFAGIDSRNGPIGGIVSIVGAGYLSTTVQNNVLGNSAIAARNNCNVTVSNITFTSAAGQGCLYALHGGIIIVGSGVAFGSCVGAHMKMLNNGLIQLTASYRIDGNAAYHVQASGSGSNFQDGAYTVTLAAGLTFTAYVFCYQNAFVQMALLTFSTLTATGQQWDVRTNGVYYYSAINHPTGVPGSIAGTTTTGGQIE